MSTQNQIIHQISALVAGMAVSFLMVFACFAAVVFLMGNTAEAASEEPVITAR